MSSPGHMISRLFGPGAVRDTLNCCVTKRNVPSARFTSSDQKGPGSGRDVITWHDCYKYSFNKRWQKGQFSRIGRVQAVDTCLFQGCLEIRKWCNIGSETERKEKKAEGLKNTAGFLQTIDSLLCEHRARAEQSRAERLPPRPAALGCDMRWESRTGGCLALAQSHRMYLNKFQRQKLMRVRVDLSVRFRSRELKRSKRHF